MEIKILYEDKNVLVIDKPAGIIVFNEKEEKIEKEKLEKTLIDYILEIRPEIKNVGKAPRYGIVHRLDKDTSGILLIAKNNKALFFFQKQFKTRSIVKKYIALVSGVIKEDERVIKTLIGRSYNNYKKQKVYLFGEPDSKGKREAITFLKVIKRFSNCTLIEVIPKTGRKHQIRCHLSYINHPIIGDNLYGFKNQDLAKKLNRHFLHASYIKFQLPEGKIIEIKSDLPQELKNFLSNLK